MTRWTDADTIKKSEAWELVRKHAEKLKLNDIDNQEHKAEAKRFKDVVRFISLLIKSASPGTTPGSVWGSINGHVTECAEHLQSFGELNNQAHEYATINDALDSILREIRPFVTPAKEEPKYAGALGNYIKDAECKLDALHEECQKVVEKVDDQKQKADAAINDINRMRQDIENFHLKLLGRKEEENSGERSDSLSSIFSSAYSSLMKYKKEIEEFYKQLTKGDASEDGAQSTPPIINDIHEAQVKVNSDKRQIEQYLSEIKDPVAALKCFHEEVFGKKNEDGGHESGLRKELEQRMQELEDFKTAQEGKCRSLTKTIEDLLPGALSAGLASAYSEREKIAGREVVKYTNQFHAVISLLVLVGCYTVFGSALDEMIAYERLLDDFYSPRHWLTRLMIMAPIIIPLSWWALFFSKRRSESSRLREEYAHKEALAKSYEGYKKQVDTLEDKDVALITQLMKEIINSIAFNPSTTLDKKHGDKSPYQIFDRLNSSGEKKPGS